MKIKHKKRVYALIGILLLVAIILFLAFKPLRPYLSDPVKIKEFVLGFGIFAPIIFIILQAIQAIIPIMPGQLLVLLAGALFGTIKGSIYCLIGIFIGISVVFFIAKKYGTEVVHKHVDKKELSKLNKFIREHGDYAIFLGRVLPLFPSDVVSFGAGLTKMRYKHYIIASMLGFFPAVFLLNILGNQLTKGLLNLKTVVIVLSIVIFIVIVYKFKHQIKVHVHNALLWVEKKIKKALS
ncbi:TVP38/TMEM64 family protein [Candidatus Woesearchaeota archaeon]|nr:TVP38/TMEM64 family protein [Candidatus Woesearchaeota archaeon]